MSETPPRHGDKWRKKDKQAGSDSTNRDRMKIDRQTDKERASEQAGEKERYGVTD